MDSRTALAAVHARPIQEKARLVAEVRGQLDEDEDFDLTDGPKRLDSNANPTGRIATPPEADLGLKPMKTC